MGESNPLDRFGRFLISFSFSRLFLALAEPTPARTPTPTVADLERAFAERDPELLEAVQDLDLSLLRWSLGLTPLERLRACSGTTRTLDRLRHGTADR